MAASSAGPRPSWDFTDSESESDGGYARWCDDSDNEEEGRAWAGFESPEAAGDKLAEELLSLLEKGEAKGTLSAKAVCVLSYYATQAGAQGFVTKLAFRPDAPSGHYQRHLDDVLGYKLEAKSVYEVFAPGHDKYGMERCVHTLHTLPLHEELAKEVAENPGLGTELAQLVRTQHWAQDYYQHPVVVANPTESVYPLALYLDGGWVQQN